MASVGIDLGTTNCCVAVVENGEVVLIENSLKKRTTPSYIAFKKGKVLLGDEAKKQSAQNIENTVYDVKRFIGLGFNDKMVQRDINNWGFKVVNEDGKTRVAIKNKDKTTTYTAEDLSGLLMAQLKMDAETYLKQPVTRAVVTVPTYFTNAQRQATVDATKIAGFTDVHILNEPTAAAIAYSINNPITRERKILVFDFGGGTFDVSVIKDDKGTINVLSIDGDVNVGGNNLDQNLMNYLLDKLKIKVNNHSLLLLKYRCEEAKHDLSGSLNTKLELFGFDGMEDKEDVTVTRDEFNNINRAVFNKTIESLDNCLKKAKLNKNDIDEIVLAGGSTRNVMIKTLLTEYFNKSLKSSINPDEAVAIGAAMVAYKWTKTNSFDNLEFSDITPYSLGVESGENDLMSILIPKDSSIPASDTEEYEPMEHGQTTIVFPVYAGDNIVAKRNEFLGTVTISGFVHDQKNETSFDVTFEIDKSGLLNVSVVNKQTGDSKGLTVSLNTGNFTDLEIETSRTAIVETMNNRKQRK